jgi:hypothetical protein
LPSSGETNFPNVDSKGYKVGWGAINGKDKNSAPQFLQNAAVNIYEPSRCDRPQEALLFDGKSQVYAWVNIVLNTCKNKWSVFDLI